MLDSNSPFPKYIQLKEYLKSQIRGGHLKIGEQIPTEDSLSQAYKLSRHTVRQALKELEMEGWIIRHRRRGTFVTDQALKKNRTVAVIIKSISNYIFPDIIRGMENILSMAGFEMKLFLSQDDQNREATYIKRALENELAGLIIEPAKNSAPCGNLSLFLEMEQKRIPYLMIHSTWPELNAAYIMLDDFKGGYLATQYLLQLGHKKIAGIFNVDVQQGLNRQAGYKQALREYGIEPVARFIGEYRYDSTHDIYPYHFTSALIQGPQRPTAIFCYNDLDAIRALEAIRQVGLKVPEDISIIGFNDSILTTVSEVKLTSIKHPKRDFGRETAHLIINMIEQRIAKPQKIIQPELVIRSSCKTIQIP